jgi:hypothetical protein
MKKIALFVMLMLLLCSASACAKNDMIITTRAETTGTNITLAFEKGDRFIYTLKLMKLIPIKLPPQIAVWIEDPDGNYIETLYVTKKGGTQGWRGQPGGVPAEKIRRPESLPCWSHRRNVVYPDGLFMPTRENPLTDAVTAASPAGNFRLNTKVPQDLTKFIVLAEINSPGDYNEAYPKNVSPGSPNYSGASGQPSIIYAATVDLSSGSKTVELLPIGHGSPDGSDGSINPDLSGLTTAKDIISGITVTVE